MNLGAPEVIALAFLAVLLFGPEKLPELARKAARIINYLRGIANDARGQISTQLGPEFADLKLSDLNARGIVGHLADLELKEKGQSAGGPGASNPAGSAKFDPDAT